MLQRLAEIVLCLFGIGNFAGADAGIGEGRRHTGIEWFTGRHLELFQRLAICALTAQILAIVVMRLRIFRG